MSNIYHGLLFLHGHILDPQVLTGGTTRNTAGADTVAQKQLSPNGTGFLSSVGHSNPGESCATC